MALRILLLKKDDDREPRPDTDLHPPPSDLLARVPTFGSHDMVVLASVPHGFQFPSDRKRLLLDDDFYLIADVLEVLEPMQTGVMRW